MDGCFASSFYPPEENWPIEKCTDKKVGNSFVNNWKDTKSMGECSKAH